MRGMVTGGLRCARGWLWRGVATPRRRVKERACSRLGFPPELAQQPLDAVPAGRARLVGQHVGEPEELLAQQALVVGQDALEVVVEQVRRRPRLRQQAVEE